MTIRGSEPPTVETREGASRQVLTFVLTEQDQVRLDHLVEYFADGDRSAFLRAAIKQMGVVERAERLRELQAYGVQQRTSMGLDDVGVEDIVHRVLAKHRAE